MFIQPTIILCASFCIATAAPYAVVTSNEDNNGEESSHIDLPLSAEEIDDQDSDDNNVDIAESPPEATYLDSGDDDAMSRALRAQNFMRFGRSGAAARTAQTKGEGNARYNRGGQVDDNFIRLGRSAKRDSEVEDRRKESTYRSPQVHSTTTLRFGRSARRDNEVEDRNRSPQVHSTTTLRFGRSANFVRFGRRDDDEEAKVVASRAADSNFIRLGRANTEPNNFIRFGRAGGFIRFGRDDNENDIQDQENRMRNASFARFSRPDKTASNFIRFGRDKSSNSNFMRFGKGDNFMRFGRGSKDNFIRFGRGKNSGSLFGRGKMTDRNFIRLGRSVGTHAASPAAEYYDTEPVKRTNTAIRFGKRAPEVAEENPKSKNTRSKRSVVSDDEVARDTYNDEGVEDAALPFRYYSQLMNAPFTPEFTVLPSMYSKRGNGEGRPTGNDNFIRFG